MTETAVILAGGFGTRLQSVVSNLPKPMAPINDEPFLSYQFKYLKHFGIKKIILSIGYLSDKIQDYYKNSFEGIQISYVIEKEPLGTGGGIRLAMEQCEENHALALNGDSFFDINLRSFFLLHAKKKSFISLALRQIDDSSRYGTIITDETNTILSFKEKSDMRKPGTINAGIYILNKNFYLKHSPPLTNFSIEKDFFEKQIDQFNMSGFKFEGYFIDIGLPEDYDKAQNDFKEFKYR